jgi:hypothetical protein
VKWYINATGCWSTILSSCQLGLTGNGLDKPIPYSHYNFSSVSSLEITETIMKQAYMLCSGWLLLCYMVSFHDFCGSLLICWHSWNMVCCAKHLRDLRKKCWSSFCSVSTPHFDPVLFLSSNGPIYILFMVWWIAFLFATATS